MWNKACELGKSHIDVKAALLKSSAIASSLTSLESEMMSKSFPPESRWSELSSCKDVIALLSSEQENFSEEQIGLVSTLIDARNSVTAHSPKLEDCLPKLENFLKSQWLSNTETDEGRGKLNLSPDSEQDTEHMLQMLVDTGKAGWIGFHTWWLCFPIFFKQKNVNRTPHPLSFNLYPC